jgi:integrase
MAKRSDGVKRKTKTRGVFERIPDSGIWWIHWYDQFGKRHREKIGRHSAAIDAYQKRKNQAREGLFFPELARRRVLFKSLCEDFTRHQPAHWSRSLFTRVRDWFGVTPAASLTPQRIDEKLNELLRKGRTPATANRYRAIISAVYSWAIRNGRAGFNPARAIPLRRENNSRMRFLTKDEEKRLRKHLTPGYAPDFDLALHTGMRRGEQYSLLWKDVDLAGKSISLVKTKAGRPRRIDLNANAIRALDQLRRQTKADRVCPHSSRKWFPEVLAAAEVKEFRWHDLRHTFASRLVMAGVDIRTVQELLGHQNISMTARYAHLTAQHTREAVAKLETRTATVTATSPKTPKQKRAVTA